MQKLSGHVCLVTGASRGIGRGVALALGEQGATVYITGRTLKHKGDSIGGSLEETVAEIKSRGGVCIPVEVDHSDDEQVNKLFARIRSEQNGRLDVLVNNAFSAVTYLVSRKSRPYWDLRPDEPASECWDALNNVGLRNHYICAVLATRMMLEYRDQLKDEPSSSPKKSIQPGLIVNISSFGGMRYLFNVAYGVGKCAMDRMAVDMATELKAHGKTGVSFISLWPGLVSTEHMVKTIKDNPSLNFDLDLSESPELTGRVIAALAVEQKDKMLHRSGHVLLVSDTALSLGIRDINGKWPISLRSVSYGLGMAGWKQTARFFPGWLRMPYFFFSSLGNKF